MISLLARSAMAAQPAVALVDAADAGQWQAAKDAGWQVIVPAPAGNPDARVLALASAVRQAIAQGVDPAHVYLAGRGAGTAAVFYTISRLPDLWAAAVAIEGSPQAAVETGRIFAGNFRKVPILWATQASGAQALAGNLQALGMPVEWRSAAGLTDRALLEWLGQHQREAFPQQVDCETNTPAFASCYWIQLTKFDPGERNDMLRSTRLQARAVATLDIGPFEYRADEPGPGVLVDKLPGAYRGPLKAGDRIVELEGRPIANARAYMEMMEQYKEEKPVVAMVQRGKQRIRVEARVVVPQRENMVTARVQAEFAAPEREIRIMSRTVTEMRVTVPPEWASESKLYWNGLALEKIAGPGCYLLKENKELLDAAPCP